MRAGELKSWFARTDQRRRQRQHNSGKHHPSLHPAYGSGPIAYAPGTNGSGYYTRAEFIELLKYAAQRHIKVIPEVNFPGHAAQQSKPWKHATND